MWSEEVVDVEVMSFLNLVMHGVGRRPDLAVAEPPQGSARSLTSLCAK